MYIRYIHRVRISLGLLLLCIGCFLSISHIFANNHQSSNTVSVIEFSGTVNHVYSGYVLRGITDAKEDNFDLIVILLDTPGGLLTSTREIVNGILSSDVPVVVYVSPSGGHAGSAGAFISASAGFLAMAPGTNIGAATPVDAGGQDLNETLKAKATEDAVAFITSIADVRGRNSEAYSEMVYTSKSFAAEDAVEMNIADGVFNNLDELLLHLDGVSLPTNSGDVVVTLSPDYFVQFSQPNFWERILEFISEPTLAFLLISLGGLALTVELFNFGTWLPGIAGVIMLSIGFAGVGLLPFSWAGIALIILAILLFIAEGYAPGFGFFGIAGTLSLVLGGVFLVGFFGGPTLPGIQLEVNRWVLVVIGISTGAVVIWLSYEIRKSRAISPYRSYAETPSLIGATGIVTAPFEPEGRVFVAGEQWTAVLQGDTLVNVNEIIEVVGIKGLKVEVRPKSVK